MKDSFDDLKHLGSKITEYNYDNPDPDLIETFPSQYLQPYEIEIVFPEFTSLCPKTGQPDFATITVLYVPRDNCIETKSFKLYMLSFRNFGGFMETITNKILNDLWEKCQPDFMRVEGKFNVRGGTYLTVTCNRSL